MPPFRLSLWVLYWRLRAERRMLINGHSWWIEFSQVPWPEIWLEECSGSWRLALGWFTLWWMKPRRQWTQEMRDAHPSRQTRIVDKET